MAAMDAEADDGGDCPKGKGDKCTCSEEEKRQFREQKKKDDCTEVYERERARASARGNGILHTEGEKETEKKTDKQKDNKDGRKATDVDSASQRQSLTKA